MYTYVCILPPHSCSVALKLVSVLHGVFRKRPRGRDFMGQGAPPISQQLKQLVDVEVSTLLRMAAGFFGWWLVVVSILRHIHMSIYIYTFIHTNFCILDYTYYDPADLFSLYAKIRVFQTKNPDIQPSLDEQRPISTSETTYWSSKTVNKILHHLIWFITSRDFWWVLGIPSDGRIWCPSKAYGGFLKEHHENFPKWQK